MEHTRSRRRRRLAVLLMLAAAPLFAFKVGDALAVAVREIQLRGSPAFLAPVSERLQYGQDVTVLEIRGDWARVRVTTTGREGWLHSTAIREPREVVMTPGGRTTGAISTSEVALAGRGFNETVEREYRDQTKLDFGPVDAMEREIIPVEQLSDFLTGIGAGLEVGDAR